ncbi:hypothetical protein FTO74_08160 [Granulicella sp. WH15]|uniref:hypothetical protein n=1 Tax=Granulicella sp. WH15 TaxID=2602070 RepID=UPI001366F71C|nr:hypothetical protein [Granulicella sp. WH15]QHN03339.1 hypothetical protein FTO74_08160 [Granulicella sp. WH15]
MKALLLLLAMGADTARVTFTYAREGMPVPQYELSVSEDGSGRYVAQVAPRGGVGERQEVDREIEVPTVRAEAIMAAARGLNRFEMVCASKAKVASTGAKSMTYAGADGKGSCAYDYTENKQLVQLTNVFLGLAMTLDLGRKLEVDHRFDRLGLDADMETLVKELKDGSALEPGMIAPVLRSIAEDAQVIQRVRVRAAELAALP